MSLLIIFIVLNIFNVILQTIKSICTIKCGTLLAAVANAIAYGLYTIVIVYTVCDLPLMLKVIIVAAANFIGVYVVKAIEKKMQKDKLWLVKATIPLGKLADSMESYLNEFGISYSRFNLSTYAVFDCYCNTQKETAKVTELTKDHHGKNFATENKLMC